MTHNSQLEVKNDQHLDNQGQFLSISGLLFCLDNYLIEHLTSNNDQITIFCKIIKVIIMQLTRNKIHPI